VLIFSSEIALAIGREFIRRVCVKRGGGAALEQNKRAEPSSNLHRAARVTKALDYKNLGESFQ